MSKYEAVYFVGDNQAINRVRADSYKTRNRGAFSGSLAALIFHIFLICKVRLPIIGTEHSCANILNLKGVFNVKYLDCKPQYFQCNLNQFL